MYGKDAVKLVSDIELSDDIRSFDEVTVRRILDEMQALYEANLADRYNKLCTSVIAGHGNAIKDAGNTLLLPSIQFRHLALTRNKRCLLTYLYHRMGKLRQMRWELGSILPPEVNANLISGEVQWFRSYNKSLATYMRSIGDNYGLNLTVNILPPKSLYVEVKCLADFGKLEIDNGQIITLKKNTYHLLPRATCEPLIRQGILEHHNV